MTSCTRRHDPAAPRRRVAGTIQAALHRLTATAVVLALLAGSAAAQPAPHGPAAAVDGEARPPQVQELLTLLADPAVRQWLERAARHKSWRR